METSEYRLDDLLNLQHTDGFGGAITQLEEVYGIIYRIYCIPEDKSYIGQTFSHKRTGKYLCRRGIFNRVKEHYHSRDEPRFAKRSLYIAFNTYPISDFVVYEVKRVYGADIENIGEDEKKAIEQYKSIHPLGYNIQEGGGNGCAIMEELAKLYEFTITRTIKPDTTRARRVKDVMFNKYFEITGRARINYDVVRAKLKDVDILNAKAVRYNNNFRVVVRVKDQPINIRINIPVKDKSIEQLKEECIALASSISTTVIIDPSVGGPSVYKHTLKADKVLKHKINILTVTGHTYTYKARGFTAYTVSFFGSKSHNLAAVTFGGKTTPIEESYAEAKEFVDRLIPMFPNIKRVELKSIEESSLSKTGER